MFSMFQDRVETEKRRAREAFEKVSSTRSDSAQSRSARLRMGLLCRAHLDKTFVAGAQQTASHQELVALAIAQGKDRPPPPKPGVFQKIMAGKREVFVYLPEAYVEEAYGLGARYQKTEISANQAIERMQALADQIFLVDLHLEEAFKVLQFLRDELAQDAPSDASVEAEMPSIEETGGSGPDRS
jgi:hypothetical protein